MRGKHTNKPCDLLAVSVIHPQALTDRWAVGSVIARWCGSGVRCEESSPAMTAALAQFPSELPGWSSGLNLEASRLVLRLVF